MDHRTECDVLLDGKEVPRLDPGGTACTMETATEDTEGRRAGRKQEHTQQGASEHGERDSAESPLVPGAACAFISVNPHNTGVR